MNDSSGNELIVTFKGFDFLDNELNEESEVGRLLQVCCWQSLSVTACGVLPAIALGHFNLDRTLFSDLVNVEDICLLSLCVCVRVCVCACVRACVCVKKLYIYREKSTGAAFPVPLIQKYCTLNQGSQVNVILPVA